MNFTVVWTPAAEQDLAAVWLAAEDRTSVTEAARQIDHRLQGSPDRLGDARFDTVRTFVLFPVGVDFEVLVDDRLVYVLGAWDAGRSKP